VLFPLWQNDTARRLALRSAWHQGPASPRRLVQAPLFAGYHLTQNSLGKSYL